MFEDVLIENIALEEIITVDMFNKLLELTEQNYATNYLILVFLVSLTICLIIYSVLKKFI